MKAASYTGILSAFSPTQCLDYPILESQRKIGKATYSLVGGIAKGRVPGAKHRELVGARLQAKSPIPKALTV